MANMCVRDRDGVEHKIEARPGLTVMEVLRELDYGVSALCGGMCLCATCHVYVHPDWVSRLPTPTSDERELIAELDQATEHSRLSCQIEFTEVLNGLQVSIAPED